jgi:glycosyltransferase involved in cell wall biosynthesis
MARAHLGLEERFTAVYSGGFYEGRGLESLMDLAGKFPEVQFLWVGGKQDVVDNWRKKLADADLHNVHLTGFVPNELLPIYQMAADILIMPYGMVIAGSSGGNIADVSSPMKMFEYMASGRIILTSNMPVLLEVLNKDNAAFYRAEDMEDLVRSFGRLMQDEELRKRIAARALADVEKYSWRERMRNIIASLSRSE